MYTLDTKRHLSGALQAYAAEHELTGFSYDELDDACHYRARILGEYGRTPYLVLWLVRYRLGIALAGDAIACLMALVPAEDLVGLPCEILLDSLQTFLDYLDREDIAPARFEAVVRSRLGLPSLETEVLNTGVRRQLTSV
jgi:hypothetical protein